MSPTEVQVDDDRAHHPGRVGEEVRTVLYPQLVKLDEAQVALVYQLSCTSEVVSSNVGPCPNRNLPWAMRRRSA